MLGTSLVVQWSSGLRTSTAGGPGSIPGRGNKIPQAAKHGQKKKVLNKNYYANSMKHPTSE